MAWLLKSCAHCGGDVYVDADGERECLACARSPDAPRFVLPPSPLRRALTSEELAELMAVAAGR